MTAADEFDRDGERRERRERQLETLDRLSQRFGTSLSDAFSRNVAEGRLDGVLQSIGRTILTTALRSALQPSQDALRSRFAGLFGGEGAVTPFARGGIVSRGRAAPFASGGVVSAPTYFPRGRSLGLMGSAAPRR